MTWVKSEDDMPLHPKLLRLSDGAFRLWVNGLHFANRAVTDGRIDKALVPTLNHHGRWSPKQLSSFVGELVSGLWIDAGDHYEIHDYAHHQREAMKDRVERKREYERDKKQKQRETRDGFPVHVPTGQQTGHTREVPREASVPTRPDPTRPVESATHSPAGVRDKSPDASRADRLRKGYLERFEKATTVKPPGQARQPMGGGPWLELARDMTDEQCSPFLNAYFVDDWCRNGGYKLGALVSERVRLLTAGPTVNGQAAPMAPIVAASPELAAALEAQERAEEACRKARLYRDSVAGTEAHSEASRAHSAKQRELAMAKDRVEALSA